MKMNMLWVVVVGMIMAMMCGINGVQGTRPAGYLNTYEKAYINLPNRTLAREYLQYYTSQPHVTGTPEDYDTAIYTYNKFIEFGLKAEMVPFPVYLNYPLKREIRMLDSNGSILFTANMTEPVVSEDPTSNNSRIIPTFNGYSAAGNVTGQLVYANFGMPEDFQYLQTRGINVTGKVVIVRYGGVMRGVKVMLAQKFGAVGVIIYSDPQQDGYVKAGGVNNTFPNGPWRPEEGVQRGSVQYLPICPGSPSQERVALCLGDERANESFVGSLIPSIPSQPISWGDAYPLLKALAATTPVPQDSGFQGGLNFTYGFGPTTEQIHFALEMNYTTVTLWDVIATLPGKTSDEVVVMGNHRDAWVFGATDPSSGTSVMLETARSLALLKNTTSWVPERDIIFCSWDGEEQGLLGSTAWGEANADYIRKHVVAYVNTDVGVGGPDFSAGGTPSLVKLIKNITAEVLYPGNSSLTVADTWSNDQLYVLGSGSDYTVFIGHLGVPSLDLDFYGDTAGGIYHSIYDSFYWMDTFGDPGFVFHEGMAQILGLVLMRLSDSIVHPFNYTNYGVQLSSYLTQIEKDAPKGTDFTELSNAISQFTHAGADTDAQVVCVKSNATCGQEVDLDALNARLRFTERRMLLNALTTPNDGLPGRPWFKHVANAPGMYAGYAAQTFPGIAQYVYVESNQSLLQQQISRAANTISNAAQALTKLSVSGQFTPLGCFGSSVAVISVSSQGGFTPVLYSLNKTVWQSNTLFNNLTDGVYTVYVQDAQSITSTITITVSQPPKLTIEVESDGNKAKVNVTGGVGNYTIQWSTGENTTSVEFSEAKHYNVTVTDENGCLASATGKYEPKGEKKLGGGAIAGITFAVLITVGGTLALVNYYVKQRRTQNYAVL